MSGGVKEASAEYRSGELLDACPVGYKRTEVGVIPDDWSVVSIGKICKIAVGKDVDGCRYSADADSKYCYPIFSNTVDVPGIYGYYDVPEYSGEVVTVVGRGVGLGTAICRSGGFGAIGRLIILFPNKGVNTHYLASFINHEIDVFSESSGVPQLTGISVANYRIALPLPDEQTAIANALSDVDALITSLETLITKKRAIKTAAMQQLLTGKKRLPPYDKTHTGYKQTELGEIPEDWEVVELGSISFIKTGSKNNQDKVLDGAYPFYVRSQNVERINEYSYDCEAILIPGEGNIGEIFHYINGKFDAHQRVYVIRAFTEEVSAQYIFYFMKERFGKHAMENSVKATVDSLRLPTFVGFKVIKPATIDEQNAIATVLYEMDGELDALANRLTKTQHIKQGMMQELLTGKTRLI